ncbi:hypothetical protein SEMRO_1197_G251520.1 [Seminavis robusta]|uniref:Uncharacterized protein n=1 Tax=Seminavis robusta TaxID=568900 RepID=A0A9N8EJF5_9STRA|nr:hypothetical protein SEMRO_1197_G251520.1 [Seminavis robusta]|eukprot:Sro1197_g251520.1 n/a (694) ;mRNA; r:12342-14515
MDDDQAPKDGPFASEPDMATFPEDEIDLLDAPLDTAEMGEIPVWNHSRRSNGPPRFASSHLMEAPEDDDDDWSGPRLPSHSLIDSKLMEDPTNYKSVQIELQDAVEGVDEADSNSESAGSIDPDKLEQQIRDGFIKSALTELAMLNLYDLCWWLFKWPRLIISYLLGALGCKRWFGLDEPDEEKKDYPTVYKEMSVEATKAANANVAAGPQAMQAAPTAQRSTLAATTTAAVAAGIAITAAVMTTRTPGAAPPADSYSRPLCNSSSADDYVVKMGITRLVVQNVTPEEVNANKDNLEEAFRDIFKNQTDACADEYERFMLGNELVQVENITAGDTPLTLTVWESNVSCIGCPDINPLFDEGPSPGAPEESANDIDINERFDDFVTRMSPEIAATIDDTTKKADGPTLTQPQPSTPKTRNTPIVYIDAVDPNNPDVIIESQGTMPEKMEVPNKEIPPVTSSLPENSDRGDETAPNDQEPPVATPEDQPTATTSNNQAPSTPNLINNEDNLAPSAKDRGINQAPSASNGNNKNNPGSTPTTSNNPDNQAPSATNGSTIEAPSITNDTGINKAPSTTSTNSQAPAAQNNPLPTDSSGSTAAFPSNPDPPSATGNTPAGATNAAPSVSLGGPGNNNQRPTVQSGFGSPHGPETPPNVAAAIPTTEGRPSGSTGPVAATSPHSVPREGPPTSSTAFNY